MSSSEYYQCQIEVRDSVGFTNSDNDGVWTVSYRMKNEYQRGLINNDKMGSCVD